MMAGLLACGFVTLRIPSQKYHPVGWAYALYTKIDRLQLRGQPRLEENLYLVPFSSSNEEPTHAVLFITL